MVSVTVGSLLHPRSHDKGSSGVRSWNGRINPEGVIFIRLMGG
jgi:hypothetical protein